MGYTYVLRERVQLLRAPGYSSRGPRFDSQHPPNNSQTSVTFISSCRESDIVLLSAMHTVHMYTHTQINSLIKNQENKHTEAKLAEESHLVGDVGRVRIRFIELLDTEVN